MGHRPIVKRRERKKAAEPPPKVCVDCYWKREYEALAKTFLELRGQLVRVTLGIRKAQLKRRGSPTLPTEHGLVDLPPTDDSERTLQGYEKSSR